MEITADVKPNSKAPSVLKVGSNSYIVKVDAQARNGRANMRLIEILSRHFGVPKSSIRIRSGFSGRRKRIDIIE